tara:strand:+ start:4547 stop:4816 length:270 start_codon:yes stop_codon:yes gene_type:complete
MRVILTVLISFLALNANALSFTERVSMKYALHLDEREDAKRNAMDHGIDYTGVYNYSQLVQVLFAIIVLMSGVIIYQKKKIKTLTVEEE